MFLLAGMLCSLGLATIHYQYIIKKCATFSIFFKLACYVTIDILRAFSFGIFVCYAHKCLFHESFYTLLDRKCNFVLWFATFLLLLALSIAVPIVGGIRDIRHVDDDCILKNEKWRDIAIFDSHALVKSVVLFSMSVVSLCVMKIFSNFHTGMEICKLQW